MGVIRLYFVCQHCGAEVQKDLPRTVPKLEAQIKAYQAQIFLHDCTKTGGYSAGTFGLMEIVGGREM